MTTWLFFDTITLLHIHPYLQMFNVLSSPLNWIKEKTTAFIKTIADYALGEFVSIVQNKNPKEIRDTIHHSETVPLGLFGNLTRLTKRPKNPNNLGPDDNQEEATLTDYLALDRSPYRRLAALTNTSPLIAKSGAEAIAEHKAFLSVLNTHAIRNMMSEITLSTNPRETADTIVNAFFTRFLGIPLNKALLGKIKHIPKLTQSPLPIFLPESLCTLLPEGRQFRRQLESDLNDFFRDNAKALQNAIGDKSNQGLLIQVIREQLARGIPFSGMHKEARIRTVITSTFPIFNLGTIISGMVSTLPRYQQNPLVSAILNKLSNSETLSRRDYAVINAIAQTALIKYSSINMLPRYARHADSRLGLKSKTLLQFPIKRTLDAGYRYDSPFEAFLVSPRIKAMVIDETPLTTEHSAFIEEGGVLIRPMGFLEKTFDEQFKLTFIRDDKVTRITLTDLDVYEIFDRCDFPTKGEIILSKPLGKIPSRMLEHLSKEGIINLPELLEQYKPSLSLNFNQITEFGLGARQCPAKAVVIKLIRAAVMSGLKQLAVSVYGAHNSEEDYHPTQAIAR